MSDRRTITASNARSRSECRARLSPRPDSLAIVRPRTSRCSDRGGGRRQPAVAASGRFGYSATRRHAGRGGGGAKPEIIRLAGDDKFDEAFQPAAGAAIHR
jgi:hypothetical protein